MIANLGMYDLPGLQDANDTLWSAIRSELGFGPTALTRDMDFWEIWQSPELLFAQTCGFPYRARLHGQVQLVATPDYGLEGCPPGYYCSVFIARKDDEPSLGNYSGRRFAYNEALSQSGWSAPWHHLQAQGIAPGTLVESGGHALSAKAVAEGRADFASLDALTWELLKELEPDLASNLQFVERTVPTPTLPYITSQQQDVEFIRQALQDAFGKVDQEVLDRLHLRGFVEIPAESYLAIPTPPSPESVAA